jgi:hypothetical protein
MKTENEIQKDQNITYLSKKEPFGNICGYFSAGCKMKNFQSIREKTSDKFSHMQRRNSTRAK